MVLNCSFRASKTKRTSRPGQSARPEPLERELRPCAVESSGHRPLSEVHEQQCAQHRRISTSRPKTPLFGIAIPANFHQLLGFDSDLGRVVITHSTYVEGLIPWLKSLACEKGIQTITPAVINRVRGRSPSLQLRVSTTIRGGYKLVARKGSSVQEVFIVTELEQSQLQKALERHRP